MTPVIWVALSTVTEENATAVPELLIKFADAPVKPVPVITNV